MTGNTLPNTREGSPELKRAFLDRLVERGNVMAVCAQLGLPRPDVYYWKHRDTEFARAWDLAMAIHQDKLTQDVIDTAWAVGVGRWVEATDPETGEPILDDDFERVMVLDVSGVDPRILSKLIDKRVPSVDGPGQTSVTVNNTTTVNELPRRPRLVGGSAGSQDRSVVASKTSGGRSGIEDAEVVQGTTQEPGGRADG